MNNFYIVVLFVSVLLQGSIMSVPLCIAVLFVWYIFTKSSAPFVSGFLVGIVLDSMQLHQLGVTSAIFSILLGLAYLYERKFEVQTMQFVGVSVFFASLAYGVVLESQLLFLGSIANAIFGLLLFWLTYTFFPQKELRE